MKTFDRDKQHIEIDRDGFTIVENAIDKSEVKKWIAELDQLFATDQAAIKNRAGAVYAARNLSLIHI